jgi:hypothetical protein
MGRNVIKRKKTNTYRDHDLYIDFLRVRVRANSKHVGTALLTKSVVYAVLLFSPEQIM